MALTEAERLAQALESMPEHDYQGLCPAPDTSPTSRDPGCPACQILVQAAAELRRLSADAQRYRHLRSRIVDSNVCGLLGIDFYAYEKTPTGVGRRCWKTEDTFDAAIDQAMKDTQ